MVAAQKGFSIIELLLVMGVLFTITTFTFASFQDISRLQFLKDNVLDFKSNLRLAQNQAINNVKPVDCTGDLLGYSVVIVTASNTYSLQAKCVTTNSTPKTYTLPKNIRYNDARLTTTTLGSTESQIEFVFKTNGVVDFYNPTGLVSSVASGYLEFTNDVETSFAYRLHVSNSGGIYELKVANVTLNLANNPLI